MEKQYIEREALKKEAYPFPCAVGIEYAVPLRAVNEAPAADVVEVKHGEWIKLADLCGVEVLKCSACGMERPRKATAFCCDCGATMDGKGGRDHE